MKVNLLVANIGIDKKQINGKYVPLTKEEQYNVPKTLIDKRYEQIKKQFDDHILILSESSDIENSISISISKRYATSDKYYIINDGTCSGLEYHIFYNQAFINGTLKDIEIHDYPLEKIDTDSNHYMHGLLNLPFPLHIINVHRQSNCKINILDDLKLLIDDYYNDNDNDNYNHNNNNNNEYISDDGYSSESSCDCEECQRTFVKKIENLIFESKTCDVNRLLKNIANENKNKTSMLIAGDFNIHDGSFPMIKKYLEDNNFIHIDTDVLYVGSSVHDHGYCKNQHMHVFYRSPYYKLTVDLSYLQNNI